MLLLLLQLKQQVASVFSASHTLLLRDIEPSPPKRDGVRKKSCMRQETVTFCLVAPSKCQKLLQIFYQSHATSTKKKLSKSLNVLIDTRRKRFMTNNHPNDSSQNATCQSRL
jgi:hypothetical protein